jgi:hypothetical protein
MINARLWGVFHDGNLVSVSGEVPGNVQESADISRRRLASAVQGRRDRKAKEAS